MRYGTVYVPVPRSTCLGPVAGEACAGMIYGCVLAASWSTAIHPSAGSRGTSSPRIPSSPPHTDIHRDPVQTTRAPRPPPVISSGVPATQHKYGAVCPSARHRPSTSTSTFPFTLDQEGVFPNKTLSAFETQTAPDARDWLTGAVSEIATRPRQTSGRQRIVGWPS